MNEIILSFRPEFFKPILFGMKHFEYRKRFRKEPTKAYLYLSRPVQGIVGILNLGKPYVLEELLNNYDEESKEHQNIQFMIEAGNNLAIPIKSLELFDQPLYLSDIQEYEPRFKPPMSYSYLANYKGLNDYIIKKEIAHRIPINEACTLTNNIGVTVNQMEESVLYRKFEDEMAMKYSQILEILG